MSANNIKSRFHRMRMFAGLAVAVALAIGLPSPASAEPGLNASSQTKVNKAKSKRWSTSDGKTDGYQKQDEKTLVNIGSKRAGTCNVNVGTVQPGEKAPKEIIVTTKEVINVCK